VVVLVTADEEIGSPAGRKIIEAVARDVSAVLVLEPSETGRLKVARKGVSNYDLHVAGRSAHAGLEPENGVNALVAAAGLVLAVEALAAPELGTTVTPTTATAGTTRNTVPATASVALDVRAATIAEQMRVDDGIRAMRCDNGATLTIEGGVNRPPLEEESSARLLALAHRAAQRCGLGAIDVARVGGGSDGNLTAAMGVPTLDGLGAVGAGAHAEGEYVLVSSMPERAALLAALIVEIGRELR
jgi:glutamate carboxypeptidase